MKEEDSESDVWWGPVNKPMTPEVSERAQHFPRYLDTSLSGEESKTEGTKSDFAHTNDDALAVALAGVGGAVPAKIVMPLD